jgi:hypothetical protein
MKATALVIGGLLAAVAGIAWSGFVLTILWGWFVVPLFGPPGLTIPAALGLALVVGYVTKDGQQMKPREDFGAVVLKVLLGLLLRPAVALGIGRVIRGFL